MSDGMQKSLGVMFDEAARLHAAIENSSADSSDSQKQENVQTCIKLHQELWRAVDQNKVFSSNEEIGDLHTNDIKFLTVLYSLGDLQERIVDTNRGHNLRNAVRCFQAFMRLCLDYEIIPEKEYERYVAFLCSCHNSICSRPSRKSRVCVCVSSHFPPVLHETFCSPDKHIHTVNFV